MKPSEEMLEMVTRVVKLKLLAIGRGVRVPYVLILGSYWISQLDVSYNGFDTLRDRLIGIADIVAVRGQLGIPRKAIRLSTSETSNA